MDRSMRAKNSLEELLIEPIIIVCDMFLDQLHIIEYKYSAEKLPKSIINLCGNMENLVKSYKEDKKTSNQSEDL